MVRIRTTTVDKQQDNIDMNNDTTNGKRNFNDNNATITSNNKTDDAIISTSQDESVVKLDPKLQHNVDTTPIELKADGTTTVSKDVILAVDENDYATNALPEQGQSSIATETLPEQQQNQRPISEGVEEVQDDSDEHDKVTIDEAQQQQQQQQEEEPGVVKLIKSSRLKGYMTMTLTAFINFDAARNSQNLLTTTIDDSTMNSTNSTYTNHNNNNSYINNTVVFVPSTDQQRIYTQITAIISLLCTLLCCIIHFDRISPKQAIQQKIYIPLFQNGSKYELLFIVLLVLWWSIATGINTSVNGIAGDGKQQYSLYYSTWACCLTSYWLLERWFVAAGWSSLNSFIASWPNRSPAWICIMMISFFTMIWYLDLWQNHGKLDRISELYIIEHFNSIGDGQWQWLILVSVCTFCPAVFFVMVELFRETKADGSIAIKSNVEALVEGIWLFGLTIAWIATVMIATTPRGAASLIGNSYFFTWAMPIFVLEGFIWYIHDRRKATYQALKAKQEEYRQQQEYVLQQAKEIQRKYEEREDSSTPLHHDSESTVRRGPQSKRGLSYDLPENIGNNLSNNRSRRV